MPYLPAGTRFSDLRNTQDTEIPLMMEHFFFTKGLSSITAPWRKSTLTKRLKIHGSIFLFNPMLSVDPLYPPPASYEGRDAVA